MSLMILISNSPEDADAAVKDIVGEWSWVHGQKLVVLPNYRIEIFQNAKKINEGTWECPNPAKRQYIFRHRHGGWVDRVTLSKDGRRLKGRNNKNNLVQGKRIGSTDVIRPLPPKKFKATTIGPIDWWLGSMAFPERRQYYGVNLKKAPGTLVIRVKNGNDDTGDKCVDVLLRAPSGNIVLNRKACRNGWDEIRYRYTRNGQYFVILQDHDTCPSGAQRGNGGTIMIQIK